MTSIGYAGAFLGGVFALASPCGGLLLPAFFAYAFGSRSALLARTAIFYVGLAAVLVPLGVVSSQASRLVFGHQRALAVSAGLLLIAFGMFQALGGGFTIAPPSRLRVHPQGGSPLSVLLLGAVSGLTGFCTGPILGAVLTVAAASGQALRGGILLAVYAAGMAAPLFVLAALWERSLAHRRWLRGRGFQVGPFRLHTTSLLSGGIFAVLGVLFLVSEGLEPALLPTPPADWSGRLMDLAGSVQTYVPDLVLIAVAAVLVVAVTVRQLRRTGNATGKTGGTVAEEADGESDGELRHDMR